MASRWHLEAWVCGADGTISLLLAGKRISFEGIAKVSRRVEPEHGAQFEKGQSIDGNSS